MPEKIIAGDVPDGTLIEQYSIAEDKSQFWVVKSDMFYIYETDFEERFEVGESVEGNLINNDSWECIFHGVVEDIDKFWNKYNI